MATTLDLDVDDDLSEMPVPDYEQFFGWIDAALPRDDESFSVSVRVVGKEESRRLNRAYRDKDRPTNVLSFPQGVRDEENRLLLGDVVICEPVVMLEAQEQGKVANAHWAHLTVHGILHLLGFDHEDTQAAAEMEALEVEILARLGYQDPYNQQEVSTTPHD